MCFSSFVHSRHRPATPGSVLGRAQLGWAGRAVHPQESYVVGGCIEEMVESRETGSLLKVCMGHSGVQSTVATAAGRHIYVVMHTHSCAVYKHSHTFTQACIFINTYVYIQIHSPRGIKWHLLSEEWRADCCDYRAQCLGAWSQRGGWEGGWARVGRAWEATDNGVELLKL